MAMVAPPHGGLVFFYFVCLFVVARFICDGGDEKIGIS